MPRIVDGDRWIEQRLRFLQALLDDSPDDGSRRAIEDEIASLRRSGRPARRGLRRWLGFPRLPHEH